MQAVVVVVVGWKGKKKEVVFGACFGGEVSLASEEKQRENLRRNQ